MTPTLPHRPGFSPLAAARDATQRFERQSSYECVRGILERALAECGVQFRGMDDDEVCEILNGLQELKARAAVKAME